MLHGAADTPCGAANALRGAANTANFTAFILFLANFENFSKFFGFSRGPKVIQITFFFKVFTLGSCDGRFLSGTLMHSKTKAGPFIK